MADPAPSKYCDYDDKEAAEDSVGTMNIIFIVGIVICVLSSGIAGFAQFQGMGLPIVIGTALVGLVGCILAIWYYLQKDALQKCIDNDGVAPT